MSQKVISYFHKKMNFTDTTMPLNSNIRSLLGVMETTKCPFCREDIKAGAIKCKHCGSTLIDLSSNVQLGKKIERGTLWLPIPSLVLGIICALTFLDDSAWDRDTITGVASFAIISFTLGVVSLNTQDKGKGMAIGGIVLSCVSLLILIGLAAN